MQTTHEGRTTQYAVRIMSALAIATCLGVGCGKTEKPQPPAPEAPKAVQPQALAPAKPSDAAKPAETGKWEPETVKPPKASSGDGHEGHNHGPDGHTH